MATQASTSVNIKNLPQTENIAPKDLIILDTNTGTQTIQIQNVVWGLNNTEFGQTHANAILELSASLLSGQLSAVTPGLSSVTSLSSTDSFIVNVISGEDSLVRRIQKSNVVWDLSNTSFGPTLSSNITTLSSTVYNNSLPIQFSTLSATVSIVPTDKFIINTANGVKTTTYGSFNLDKSQTNFGQNHENRLVSLEGVVGQIDPTALSGVFSYNTNSQVLDVTSNVNTTVFKNNIEAESDLIITGPKVRPDGAGRMLFMGYNGDYTHGLIHNTGTNANSNRKTVITSNNSSWTAGSVFASFQTDPNGISNPRLALMGEHTADLSRPIQLKGHTELTDSNFIIKGGNHNIGFDMLPQSETDRTQSIIFNAGRNTVDSWSNSTKLRYTAFHSGTIKWDELNLESTLGDTDTGAQVATPFVTCYRRVNGTQSERRRSYVGINGGYLNIPSCEANSYNTLIGGIVRIDKNTGSTADLPFYGRPSLTVHNGTELNGGVTVDANGINSNGGINSVWMHASGDITADGVLYTNNCWITNNDRHSKKSVNWVKLPDYPGRPDAYYQQCSVDDASPDTGWSARSVYQIAARRGTNGDINTPEQGWASSLRSSWEELAFEIGISQGGWNYDTRTYNNANARAIKVGIACDTDPNLATVQVGGDLMVRSDRNQKKSGNIFIERVSGDYNWLQTNMPWYTGPNIYSAWESVDNNNATPEGCPITVPIGGMISWPRQTYQPGAKIPRGWVSLQNGYIELTNARENYPALVNTFIKIGATEAAGWGQCYWYYDSAVNKIKISGNAPFVHCIARIF